MSHHDDPLDDPGEGMPVSPGRRRLALVVGILMLLLILATLAWFIATNTETADGPPSIFSALPLPGDPPRPLWHAPFDTPARWQLGQRV